MTQARLPEILDPLGSTYDIVEIRSACDRIDGSWVNILTTIRFSLKNALDLKAWTGRVESTDFRTVQRILEIDGWREVQNGIKSGKLEFDDLVVDLGSSRDISELNFYLEQYHSSYFLASDWPRYVGVVNRTSNADIQPRLDRLGSELRKLDYRDAYQAVSESLGVNFNPNMNLTTEMLIALPVYAKITNVDFDGQLASLMVTFHKRLQKARVVAQLLSAQAYTGRFGPRKDEIVRTLAESEPSPLEGDFCQASISGKLSGAALDDYLDIRLVFDGLEIGEKSEQVRAGLRKYPNQLLGTEFPLTKVLAQFCSLEELSNQLLTPEKVKRGKLKGGRLFERAIAWLLATCGFSVVKLDECERLTEHITNVVVGDVDVIAYSQQFATLFLVSCTIATPTASEVNKIKRCAERMRERFPKDSIRVIPVLASPTTEMTTLDANVRQGLLLIDGKQLSDLFERIRLGDTEGVRAFWGLY